MNKKPLIALAAVAAALLFAGCTPAAEEPPADTPITQPAPDTSTPTDTGDMGTGGEVDPSTVDPNITVSGGGASNLPAEFPAGIPVYAANVLPETFTPIDGGYEVAFSGAPEDVVKLIDAFKANGFAISGTDTTVAAAKTEYNILINSDPASLPAGAAYSYAIFPN